MSFQNVWVYVCVCKCVWVCVCVPVLVILSGMKCWRCFLLLLSKPLSLGDHSCIYQVQLLCITVGSNKRDTGFQSKFMWDTILFSREGDIFWEKECHKQEIAWRRRSSLSFSLSFSFGFSFLYPFELSMKGTGILYVKHKLYFMVPFWVIILHRFK